VKVGVVTVSGESKYLKKKEQFNLQKQRRPRYITEPAHSKMKKSKLLELN
jgi:hypothetical protein